MDIFGLFEEPKNIIEMFTFDLTTFFYEDDYEEIACTENEGVFMIEFEKALPWMELGLFETTVFRVFNDKRNILGSNHINVRFTSKITDSSKRYIVKLVNKLNIIYGLDDDNSGSWMEKDDEALKLFKLKRQWTLGEGKSIYAVRLLINDSVLVLEVLFFNHLVELTNNS